jgi:hypothetical protein
VTFPDALRREPNSKLQTLHPLHPSLTDASSSPMMMRSKF